MVVGSDKIVVGGPKLLRDLETIGEHNAIRNSSVANLKVKPMNQTAAHTVLLDY